MANPAVNLENLSDDELEAMPVPEDTSPTLNTTDEDPSEAGAESVDEEDESNLETDKSTESEDASDNTDPKEESSEDLLDQDEGNTDEDESLSDEEIESEQGEQPSTDEEEQGENGKSSKKPELEALSEDKGDKSTKTDPSSDTPSSEEQLAKIYAPFNAAGKQVKIKSPEEAITLMQKGIGYEKAMAEVKPIRKIGKLLTNANIDENRLNFLLDLHKGEPKAINALLKESKLDPDTLAENEEQEYTPNRHSDTVTEAQMDLESTFKSLSTSPHYDNLVSSANSFDLASRQVIAQHPAILEMLEANMRNGAYDVIDAEVTLQRALGKLNGLSDLEAYRQVGETLQANGGFNHIGNNAEVKKPQAKRESAVETKQTIDPDLSAKRRAAGNTRTAPKAAKKPLGNVLSMSDEEVMKL